MGRSTNTITTAPGYLQQEQADMTALNNQNAAVQNFATNGSPLVQAQLQQATNQNTQNAAGVIANAKGINPAMAAREAGYNAANSQQQAANSAAQTQGQIQLGAQNQLSNNLSNQYAADTGLYNSQSALNQQNNQFQANLGLQTAKAITSSVGSMVGAAAANGGMVPKMAGGGSADADPDPESQDTLTKINQVPFNVATPQQQDPYAEVSNFFSSLSSNGKSGPNSQAGQMISGKQPGGLIGLVSRVNSNPELSGVSSSDASPTPDDMSSPTPDQAVSLQSSFARGGKAKHKIPAMVSPGEVYLKPGQAKAVAKGKVDPIKAGERIPGKPKVPGNSYANDIVPKKLDAGGVVIPNSIMQSSDPAHNAYKFVQAVMAQKKAKGKR